MEYTVNGMTITLRRGHWVLYGSWPDRSILRWGVVLAQYSADRVAIQYGPSLTPGLADTDWLYQHQGIAGWSVTKPDEVDWWPEHMEL